MNNDEECVYRYLMQNAYGKNNKKTSSQIKDACRLPSGGKTNEKIREIIRSLIENHKKVIGSNSKGFWVIQNEGELSLVLDSLQSRGDAIIFRKDKLKEK